MSVQHVAPDSGVWEAQDTTVADVERQLGRILRELAAPGQNGDGAHPLARASVLNLLVHADEEGEAERAAAAMASLATRHPSRTLLLVTVPDAPADGLDARISMGCGDWPAGKGQLCFEQVQLTARGATALHLASVAEPLLVSNLPTYLWWIGRPPPSHDPLLGLADRLIVDSADFPDALAGLAVLDACAVAGDTSLEIGDLAWRRIAPWCQIVAQFFDPLDARPYQRCIRRVDVEYAATSGGVVSAEPLLLVGWLAARLDWEPATASAARGSLDAQFARSRGYEGDGDTALVRTRPRHDTSVPAGELISITLTAGEGSSAATFEVHAGENAACCTTRVVLPNVRELERNAPLGQLSQADLLARELERPGADLVYAETLAMVGRLVR